MQNKPVKVEMLGINNNGIINSISSNAISVDSAYKNSEITDDLINENVFWDYGFSINSSYAYGYSYNVNKNILIFPVTKSWAVDGGPFMESEQYYYAYSQDDGESWNISMLCDENGDLTDKTPFQNICYANGIFYALHEKGADAKYSISYDGTIWENQKTEGWYYAPLLWVESFSHTTILMLFADEDFNVSLSYSTDNGKSATKITTFERGVYLDRIYISDDYVYVYNSGRTSFFVPDAPEGTVYKAYKGNNNASDLSFSAVDNLRYTINMKHRNVKYKDSTGTIKTEKCLVCLIDNMDYEDENRHSLKLFDNSDNLLSSIKPPFATGHYITTTSLNIINNVILLGGTGIIDGRSYTGMFFVDFTDDYTLEKGYSKFIPRGPLAYYISNQSNGKLITNGAFASKAMRADVYNFENDSFDYNNIDENDFVRKPIYMNVDDTNNQDLYTSTTISKNNFYKTNNQSYQGLLFDTKTTVDTNNNGYHDYDVTLFVYGQSIQKLLIFFDKDNDIYPTKIIINGDEYANSSNVFYVDFSYPKYDNLVIQFVELNKSEAQLRIGGISTDVNCVFDRGNGLNSVTFASIDENVPYYGVVSYSGNLEINDREGRLKLLSDLGFLPNIQINVYINNIKVKTFTANNDISYSDKDALVSIELLDEIQFLQQINTGIDLYYKDLNAVSLFNSLAAKFPYQITLTNSANSKLLKINISQIFIEKNTWWEVWNSFCVGTKTLLYKDINDIYRVGD